MTAAQEADLSHFIAEGLAPDAAGHAPSASAQQQQLPRAGEIDQCLSEAAARARQLHGLLAQWQLPHMSQEQSARLLAYIEEVLLRVRESTSALGAWDDKVQKTLGPEPCQVRRAPQANPTLS